VGNVTNIEDAREKRLVHVRSHFDNDALVTMINFIETNTGSPKKLCDGT
jgi:hypothetical protein